MTLLQRTEPAPGGSAAPQPGRSSLSSLTLARVAELAVAALAGVVCVLLGVVAVALPTVVAWIADERSTAGFWQTLGAAVDVWALAHRAEIRTPDADVVLAPLLLTALPLLICWWAARQVVLNRDEMFARVPVIGGWRAAWHALGGSDASAFVLGYLVAGLVVGHATSFGLAPVFLPSLVTGAVLVPLVAVVLVWWAEHRREQHPAVSGGLRWVEARTPVLLRRALPAAGEALVGLTAATLLLVLGLLLVRWERVLTLYGALDAGVVGTSVLTLGQLLALPNLMVWALGWLTGAGVTVGTVHVGWSSSSAGDLPLLPVLGALPEPGTLPPLLWGGVLVPVLAGCWLGHRAARAASRLSTWWTKTQIALLGSLLVAATGLLLGWLATGGLTPGLLGTVGVAPLLMAGLLLLEVGGGAVLAASASHLLARRRVRVR
ncbi:hypothetical protein GCM10009584_09350 [Ornithinimicrobium humiphilum]|uniref:Integral membrane protein n=1 Tax=Ornithinimicrobium humiphilum TaxID=125288 RepID=A0A543KQU2_9MICO|nr:hypothetical protein FB476_2357 [Ornithinimicrobium humiphilum]